MPGQLLFQPNPPPDPSQLPDSILDYRVQLKIKGQFRRAADYIAAAMIFLRSNTLVTRQITPDDIKPRLLGHWGTCPGLVLVYAHINRLIRKTGIDALYVVGPGHGAPAILSCLWLENSLSAFYPKYSRDKQGLHNLIAAFSAPGGFPSHVNAETPGSIHEGGELGYALGVSFGAVMDKPDLVCVCVIGDGEAETGPTATAWHGYKYIDPAESGAVLPIVHVNGFKISERTIYGTMDDKEMTALFTGYGYQVRFVEDLKNIDEDLAASMDWALERFTRSRRPRVAGTPSSSPAGPCSFYGWSGPKELHGEYMEGSFKAHQVPLPEAKTDAGERKMLQTWLESYGPRELFGEDGVPNEKILSVIPDVEEKKLGQRKEAFAAYTALNVPEWIQSGVKKGSEQSCMKVVGEFLHEVVKENPSTFRIFSPDELVSNKLDAVLRDSGRNFQWDVASRAKGGRVIEILSEHTCQAMLQGYTLTGRTGLFPSYEASWASEHNGFSHQNPSFIGAVLNLKPAAARQTTHPVWLSPEEADRHCIAGASVWKFASTEGGVNPDVVLVTFEVIAAAALLRQLAPALRVRVVNVTDLMVVGPTGSHPHALSDVGYASLFTQDKPGLLFGRPNLDRISIEGYREEGTTTSPFSMMLLNHTSRYHVAAEAIRGAAMSNPQVEIDAHELISYVLHLAEKAKDYAIEHGADPEGTFDAPKFD
ncbi:putative phosphoketolase [Grifola frondosa]|uniref:Putative phosphoketolase n=1 Tax=Grifola frondosa TaxID=5627 RepID=A0A1C7M673_GRIFR|nr:putative phosphoketolase [Grifola frondosa]